MDNSEKVMALGLRLLEEGLPLHIKGITGIQVGDIILAANPYSGNTKAALRRVAMKRWHDDYDGAAKCGLVLVPATKTLPKDGSLPSGFRTHHGLFKKGARVWVLNQ